jgi:hypothetical protein
MSAGRWTFLAACFAFGTPLCFGLLFSFVSTTGPAGALLFPASMLALVGYLVAGLTSIGVGIAQASKGRWGEALQSAVVPAAVAMFVAFPGTYKAILNAADYIHFAIFSGRYERAVDAAPRTDGPRLLWFFWADASAPLAGETLVFLVFDESDELALPNAQRSAAWKARALSGFMKATGFVGGPTMPEDPHRLFGHYYVLHLDY